ncbi:MAG: hypothetical protein ABIW32_08645 [Terrimesophilobacter sp.]
MFLYTSGPLNIGNDAALRQVFDLVDAVGTKTLSQTERYADANVVEHDIPPASRTPLPTRMSVNAVASPGRRLKRAVPIGAIVVPTVVILVVIVNLGSRFFESLFGG